MTWVFAVRSSSRHTSSTMKSFFAFLLILGAAMAFVRPMAPVQVDAPIEVAAAMDHPFVPEDVNMMNARKCT